MIFPMPVTVLTAVCEQDNCKKLFIVKRGK